MIKTVIKGIRSSSEDDKISPYEPILQSHDFETFNLLRYTIPKFLGEKSNYLNTLFNLLTKRNVDGLAPREIKNYLHINGYTDGIFGFLYHPEIELFIEELNKVKGRENELKKFIEKEYENQEFIKKMHSLIDEHKILKKMKSELKKIEKGDLLICSLSKI